MLKGDACSTFIDGSLLLWKKRDSLQLKIECRNWRSWQNTVNSIPCCMLFASSKLQKATIPAVLSWSMLNTNLWLNRKHRWYLFSQYATSLSQTNHGTGLQRAVVAPSVQNPLGLLWLVFLPLPKQLIMKQSRVQQTTLQTSL